MRKVALPQDRVLGPATLNVGTIAGGRAPNVVADEARAEIMFRTVGDPGSLREGVATAVTGRAEAHEVLHTPAVMLGAFDGLAQTTVAFTTDIPALMGAWGEAVFDWAGEYSSGAYGGGAGAEEGVGGGGGDLLRG